MRKKHAMSFSNSSDENKKRKIRKSGKKFGKSIEPADQTAIASYLVMLQRFPQLKHEQVVELFKIYEAGGAPADAARTKLIECNLRLVVSIAKQFKGHNIPIEDLIQEGNMGLMKSIERFKWSMGFRFSTYSTWWIKQAIGQHVLKRKRMIRLPAHAASAQRKMIAATETFKKEFGGEPSAEDLAALTGTSQTVVDATMHSGRGIVSLSQPMGTGEGSSEWADHLEDDSEAGDPFEQLAEKQLLNVTMNVLNGLPKKEMAIIRLRFGLSEPYGDEYNITASQERDIAAGNGFHDD